MRKLIIFLMLLFVGVFTSACVNTYAVKQLNEIAIEYMEKGDVNSAISRLEASIDLDANIYESRYNLAVAYHRTGNCEKALEQIKTAQSLRKDEEPAIYYMIGAIDTCLSDNLYKIKNEKGEIIETNFSNEPLKQVQAAKKSVEYLTDANENFDKYTHLEPNADDTKTVLEVMNKNKEEITEKKKLFNR